MQKKNKVIFIIIIIGLFLMVFTTRAMWITADPPSDLSWSGGLYGDEFAYAHNARNKALFNQWITDEWNPFLYNPILTFFDYLSFKTFNVSFFSLRVVPLFWGMLSAIFLFFIFYRNSYSFFWAILGFILIETNYFFAMYSRLSLSDTMLTNWMIMALFFWVSGRKNRFAMFFSGVSSVGVFSCKPTAVYFMGVLFLAYVFHFLQGDSQSPLKERKNIKASIIQLFKNAWPFLIGVVTAGGIWFVFFYIPNHAEITRFSVKWRELAMPKNFRDLMSHLFGKYAPITFKHFAWFPFILLTGWLYAPLSLYRLFKHPKKFSSLELVVLLWCVIGYLSISGFHYRPPRYFLSLALPMILFAWMALRWILSFDANKIKIKGHKIFTVFYVFWAILTIFLTKKFIYIRENEIFLLIILFLTALTLLSFILFTKKYKRHKAVTLFLVLTIVALSLAHNLSLYAKWVTHPTYNMLTASRKVGTLVSNGTIAGLWAPMICMENNNHALCIASGWFNAHHPYEKYHFTHLFLWRGNQDAELKMIRKPLGRKFLKAKLKLLERFKIKNAWALFFAVKP